MIAAGVLAAAWWLHLWAGLSCARPHASIPMPSEAECRQAAETAQRDTRAVVQCSRDPAPETCPWWRTEDLRWGETRPVP